MLSSLTSAGWRLILVGGPVLGRAAPASGGGRSAGVAADLTAITSQEFGAPARRPGYSVLAPLALTAAGLAPLRPWREALAAYLGERGKRRGA